jgi:hypothetical protein
MALAGASTTATDTGVTTTDFQEQMLMFCVYHDDRGLHIYFFHNLLLI